jgi:hypothetical protein
MNKTLYNKINRIAIVTNRGTCQIWMSTVIVSETQNADYTFDNINVTMIEKFFLKELIGSNIDCYCVSCRRSYVRHLVKTFSACKEIVLKVFF